MNSTATPERRSTGSQNRDASAGEGKRVVRLDPPREPAHPLVFSVKTKEYRCPECGRIVVPTDDEAPPLAASHRCH